MAYAARVIVLMLTVSVLGCTRSSTTEQTDVAQSGTSAQEDTIDSTLTPPADLPQDTSTSVPHTPTPATPVQLTATVLTTYLPAQYGLEECLIIYCSLHGVSRYECDKVVTIWTGGGKPLFGQELSGEELGDRFDFRDLEWPTSSYGHRDNVRRYDYSSYDPLCVVVIVHVGSRQLLFRSDPLRWGFYPTVAPKDAKPGKGVELLFALVLGNAE